MGCRCGRSKLEIEEIMNTRIRKNKRNKNGILTAPKAIVIAKTVSGDMLTSFRLIPNDDVSNEAWTFYTLLNTCTYIW